MFCTCMLEKVVAPRAGKCTLGRKIQGVEAPKVIAYPPVDNSACSNLLFKFVMTTYEEYKWRHQSDF